VTETDDHQQLRDLPDALHGYLLLNVEACLTTIAHLRLRGERVSDQEETVKVIQTVLNALGLVEAECRFCGGERGVMEDADASCSDGGPHHYLWDIRSLGTEQ
jgi:hypothetical protein